mgnify:CR=1 FL=1
MIKYLLLDLDGTLYEKQSVVLRYLKVFAERENYDFSWLHEQFTQAYIKAKEENYPTPIAFWSKVHDIFMEFIQSSQREFLEELALQAKDDALLGIQARPYLKELLEKAKASGMQIVVFTGSNDMYNSIQLHEEKEEFLSLYAFKQKQLEKLGLSSYVDRLVLTSEYGGYKPQIFVFEKLLESLGAQACECIMIGDCYNDIGAKQVGIFSVLIGENETKEFTPNLKIQSFNELIDIIDFARCTLKPLQLMEGK